MALGSTQPLTEMSTRNVLGGKGWPALKADNLITFFEPIFYKMWESRRLTTLWASTACYMDSIYSLSGSCLKPQAEDSSNHDDKGHN
jgi:hypothetical protein